MDKESDCTGRIEAGAGTASGMCLFLNDPSPDCYCMNITGRKIMKMVALCGADYRACAIYRSKTGPVEAMEAPAAGDPEMSQRG